MRPITRFNALGDWPDSRGRMMAPRRASPLPPMVRAEKRAGAAHCFVQNEQTLFLYGGEAPNHALLADTWRFGCACSLDHAHLAPLSFAGLSSSSGGSRRLPTFQCSPLLTATSRVFTREEACQQTARSLLAFHNMARCDELSERLHSAGWMGLAECARTCGRI
jgi:hypothetical protein